MKKDFTRQEKLDGEYACRKLSEKASRIYETSDPLNVYETETGYYVRGIITDDNLTFAELNAVLEDFANELEEVE